MVGVPLPHCVDVAALLDKAEDRIRRGEIARTLTVGDLLERLAEFAPTMPVLLASDEDGSEAMALRGVDLVEYDAWNPEGPISASDDREMNAVLIVPATYRERDDERLARAGQ